MESRKVCLWVSCISISGKCDILVIVMRLISLVDLVQIFLRSPESHLDARLFKYSVNLSLNFFPLEDIRPCKLTCDSKK